MATPHVQCPSCDTQNRVPVLAKGRPRCGRCHSDLPWLADVEASQFAAAIANSSMPVLVDLWAPWCGPCRAIAPALVELSVERAGSLRVVKVNVDESPEVSARLGVQGIPTMLIFDHGVEIARQVGALPKDAIGRWFDRAVASQTAR